MTAEHGESAVDLLGENGAREFVGKGHGGEGEELIGAGALVGGEAVVAADEEDEVAAHLLVTGKDLGERGGIEGLAGGIEEDLAGCGVFGPEVKTIGLNLPHLAGREASGALHKLGGEAIEHRVARLADEIEKYFHHPNCNLQ